MSTDSPAPQHPAWRVLASRVVLAGIVVGGIFLGSRLVPVETQLAFEIGPTMRSSDGGSVTRGDLRRLEARFFDDEGETVAQTSLGMARGLAGPVTPAVMVRLPPGRYGAAVRLHASDGRRVERVVAIDLADGGYQRVDLDSISRGRPRP